MVSGEALGQETFAPPYLAPNSSAEVTSCGVNYASGSSGIFDETGSFYVCELLACYASSQLDLFLNLWLCENVTGLADRKSATGTANQLL